MAVVHDPGAGVRGDAEESGVAEADQPGIAGEHVHAEGEDAVEEDLAGDVGVVGPADPPRYRSQDDQRGGERGPPHAVCRPKRPCGRTTSTMSMGRNRTT